MLWFELCCICVCVNLKITKHKVKKNDPLRKNILTLHTEDMSQVHFHY